MDNILTSKENKGQFVSMRRADTFKLPKSQGDEDDSKKNQFFRVPRPPSKSKSNSFLAQPNENWSVGMAEKDAIEVQVGVTTGVELVLLLAKNPKHTGELDHQVYHLMESDPLNVINRNPYELVVVKKDDCQGKDFFTITRSAVTEFSRKNGTETTSLSDWLKFRNMFNLINNDPFRFPLMKAFKTYKAFCAWKSAARIWKMESAREKLKGRLFILNPTFLPALIHVHDVALSCDPSYETIAEVVPEEVSPLKKKEEEKLLSAFGAAIEVFEGNTRMVEAVGKRLHQCFIEGNRQIAELLAHIQNIVNQVCQEFSEIQFSSDKEHDWVDKISDVDMTVRDIKFMFPQRGRNRQNNFLDENIVEIYSKSQDQRKIIINFVRLVEYIVACTIANTLKYTVDQIHSCIVERNCSIVTLKTYHDKVGGKYEVTVEPSLHQLKKFFTKPFRDTCDVSLKAKRPLVFPLTKNNEVPHQFQRKNFISLLDIILGFGSNVESQGIESEAHIKAQFEELRKANTRLLSIPQSDEFDEAMSESRYIASGKIQELKLNPLAFSKNLIVIRDWLNLIEFSSSESRMGPLTLDLSDLKSNLQDDLTVAYNLFVERLHECLHYHSKHILDEMIYNSYDIKTLSEDLQLFVEECVRVEKDAYSTEERIQIIGSFFDSLRKVLKYVDQTDSFNQSLEEKFTTAEILMNEVERLLRNKITVHNATQIKKQWNEFLDAKGKYRRTLMELSGDIVNHSTVYIKQLILTVDCFCEEIDSIKDKLSSDISFDTSAHMQSDMQNEISLQLMKIEIEIKKKGETHENIQEMLDWWLNTQDMLLVLNKGSQKTAMKDTMNIKHSKEKGKNLFDHVTAMFYWKKKFWLSDILVWMETYDRLTAIKPFSNDLSQETLVQVNASVEGHIEILNQRLDGAYKGNFECKETELIKEILAAGKAWINTLVTFNDMISNPNHPSSVQLRHRLTVEMKRKGKSLLECTLADIHGRSASGFSLEKNQVKEEEDKYGKALFDLFHVERQMRSTYFMIISRVSSNGSVHLITNFMEIFQSIEKAEQVIVSTAALAASFNFPHMGEQAKELNIEMSRVSSMIKGIRYGMEVLYQAQSYYLLFSRLSGSNTFFKCAGIGYVNDCIYIKQRWQEEIINPLTSQKMISILDACEEMEIKLNEPTSPAKLVLEALFDLYESIVKADILKVAREAYPRLYFVPDDILLHSIAYEDEPQKLLKDFFKICFTGVARVDVNESEIILEGAKNQPLEIQEKHIEAIYGEHGERIDLTDPLLFSHVEGGGTLSKTPQTKAEIQPDELPVWTVKLEGRIKETMKERLRQCHEKVRDLEIDEWLNAFPLQCLWLVNEIMWVKQVESQLSSSPGQIQRLQDQMNKKIHSLTEKLIPMYTITSEFELEIKKIESLVYSTICHRDIVQYLHESRVSAVTDFSWQKFIRYYWNKEKSCCHVSCGSSMEHEDSTGFEYGFEYLGEDFALNIFREGLSMNSNAILGLAHATFGTSCVTAVSEVFGAGFEKEVIQAVAAICGQHLVTQDASQFSKVDNEDSWWKLFLGCKESKSWMQLLEVDWFDYALVSKIACALDEVRMEIASNLILAKTYSAVRYFIPTNHKYEARYANCSSPFEKLARRVCVIDWSFKIAFEAAIELKLRQCGYKGDSQVAYDLSIVISSIIQLMQKYIVKGLAINSSLTISKHIVLQIMSHQIDIGNCRFVILNAVKKGFGQFLPHQREAQLEEVYWQLLAGHADTISDEDALTKNLDLNTETDVDLNKYLIKDPLEKGYCYFSNLIKQKCLQMLDAISEDNKSIIVVGSPGAGKSSLIKLVFEAFETKLMKNKGSIGRIYTDADLKDINFLVSNRLLLGAREAHRLKLLLVEIKLWDDKDSGRGAIPQTVDQNIILDGELLNPATLKALKEKQLAELKGYNNIPRFIIECVSLGDVAPSILTSVHLIHCGHQELLSTSRYFECLLEAFEKQFQESPIIKSLLVHRKLEELALPSLLVRYTKRYTLSHSNSTTLDVVKIMRIFFDLFRHFLGKFLIEVDSLYTSSRDRCLWELIKLVVFCLAWAFESQFVGTNESPKSSVFEKEIAEHIFHTLMPHIPNVESPFDIDNILNYDVSPTSSGHFQLVATEDSSAIHENVDNTLGLANGVFLTKAICLRRKMLLQWIDGFQYDILLLGSACSCKSLLIQDVARRNNAANHVLPNSLYKLPSLGHLEDGEASNRLVIIEDLHYSQEASNALIAQERLRKMIDSKSQRMTYSTKKRKQQFLCTSILKDSTYPKNEFCSERLHRHFIKFRLKAYQESDISSIFTAQMRHSICSEHRITRKQMIQECQAFISCIMTMSFNILEKSRVSTVRSAYLPFTMMSQMYNYLEMTTRDLFALDISQLASIDEWGKILLQNLTCLSLSSSDYSKVKDTIFALCKDPSWNFLKDSPAILNVVADIHSHRKGIENEGEKSNSESLSGGLNSEVIFNLFESYCRERKWLPGGKGMKSRDVMELKFWREMLQDKVQTVLKHLQFDKDSKFMKVLFIEYTTEVSFLGHSVDLSELSAYVASDQKGYMLFNFGEAKGQDLLEHLLGDNPSRALLVVKEEDIEDLDDLEQRLYAQTYEPKNSSSSGQVQVIIQCKEASTIVRKLSQHAPSFLRFAQVCSIYGELEHTKDALHPIVAKILDECICEISGRCDTEIEVSPETNQVIVENILGIYQSSLHWNRNKQSQIVKEKNLEIRSSPFGLLFEHTYACAWLLINCSRSNAQAQSTVQQQLSAFSDLDQALETATVKYIEVQEVFERTLDRVSSLLISIAQQNHIIEQREFDFAAEEYTLKNKLKKLEQGKKKSEARVEISYQNFLKGVDDILQVSEMEIEDVRMNSKPPKLIQRLARACAYVLALNMPKTKEEVAQIKESNWAQLNLKLFSRIRVYDQANSNESRISFFKREVDTFGLESILEKVRNKPKEVEGALKELDSLLQLPDFKLNRVEQVSKALKPLCAWILAVHEYLKESIEVDKLEFENTQYNTEMQIFQNLNSLKEKDTVRRLKDQLSNLKKSYEACSENFAALEVRKRNLEYYTETCKLLLHKILPWRKYCHSALEKLKDRRQILAFEVMLAASIAVYASSLDKIEREHLKKCWGKGFKQFENFSESDLKMCSVENFDLHDFLRRNFTHEWFLEEEYTAIKILDIYNQSSLNLGSQTHLAESIGIAWLATAGLGKNCIFIDPDEVGPSYFKSWELSQQQLSAEVMKANMTCVKLEDMSTKESHEKLGSVFQSNAVVYIQSTSFLHDHYGESAISRVLGNAHFVDFTLKQPNVAYQCVCTLLSKFCIDVLPPLVSTTEVKLPITERQEELQIYSLNLSHTKRQLCNTLTNDSYKDFISKKDADQSIDLEKLQRLKSILSSQLEDFQSLSANWQKQQDVVVNYFDMLPDPMKVLARNLATLFSANSIVCGYFHSSPLNQFMSVLERKLYGKLPVGLKSGKGKGIRRQVFLSDEKLQKSIIRSMFDMLITHRYIASDWIIKTMHFAFHFEFLGGISESPEQSISNVLKEEEWDCFLELFLKHCVSAGGIERRVDLSLLLVGKGWDKKIMKAIEILKERYSEPSAFDAVETVFCKIKELNMELPMEEVLGHFDKHLEGLSPRPLPLWRFAAVLFLVASSHREEQLVALWIMKHTIPMDFNSTCATSAVDLADQIESLDNRVPLLLASPAANALQLVEQAAVRYSMTFLKISDGKMAYKGIWQVLAAKSVRSKKLHTQEVKFVSIYHLASMDSKALNLFLYRNVEDGHWLVIVDVDIENDRHRQICKSYQETIADQLFFSPPKSRFKLILCLDSHKGFNPYISSVTASSASKPDTVKILNVSFFACKCLPYICSGASWQNGEVVGIYDKNSITSPSLLSGEVLELFEAYQTYVERCQHEATKGIKIEQDKLALQQSTPWLLSEEREIGAAWRGYAIIIALVQSLVIDRQETGCGMPKSKRHVTPSHFEFIAGVQTIKHWLDAIIALRKKSVQSPNSSQAALNRILDQETIKNISSEIIGTVYGPLYGCVVFNENPNEERKIMYHTEDFHMMLWSAMFNRYFTYDILKPSFMYKLATVGSMLTKPKDQDDEYNVNTQSYPVRAMAKAGNCLVAIGDFVDTVLALPADSLSSISDLSSVAIGQVTYFKRNEDFSNEICSLQHVLLHRNVLEVSGYDTKVRAQVSEIKTQCEKLYCRFQEGHEIFDRESPKKDLVACLTTFLKSEFDSFVNLMHTVLVDLRMLEGLTDRFRDGISAGGSYQAYLLLSLSMDYVPHSWKTSKVACDTSKHKFAYSSLSLWRKQMSRIAEGLFSLCGDIRDKRMKLRFDVRRLLNPELFFDSLRLGFCVDSEGEYPSLKYDFINEKLYSESPDVTQTVRGAQKDIIVSGISVSNAIWNDITQQLQDFRMQLDAPSDSSADDVQIQCSRLLPPFRVFPSESSVSARTDVPSNALFHKSLLREEYCDLPILLSFMNEGLEHHIDQLVCTMRLPSRRSTSYWLRKATVAFIHSS